MGVGCHALLQGIFLTQGWNPHLLYISCVSRRVLYHKHHLESPPHFLFGIILRENLGIGIKYNRKDLNLPTLKGLKLFDPNIILCKVKNT